MKRRINKSAAAHKRDSKKDSVPAVMPDSDDIANIKREMEEFISQTPELQSASWKERLYNACTACGEGIYELSIKVDEAFEGFRHVAEEVATAIALIASLLHARVHHAVYGFLGKTRKTYGCMKIDRKFENRVEGVFDRLKEFSFGRVFEDIRGKRRFVERKIDEMAQKRISFTKKFEAAIDSLIERFMADRKRYTRRMATLACCFMLCCVTVNAGTVYNYSYHDIELGTVKTKTEVEQAVSQVKEKVPAEANVSVSVSAEPDVDITYERDFSFAAALDSTEAVAVKIANLDDLLADGYAINVNGVTVAMVDTEETANKILDTVKTSYITAEVEQAVDGEEAEALAIEMQELLEKIIATQQEADDFEEAAEAAVNQAVARTLVLSEGANSGTAGLAADSTELVAVAEAVANTEATKLSVRENIISKLTLDLIEELEIDIEKFMGVTLDSIYFAEEVTIEPVKAKVSSFSDYETALKNFIDEEGKSIYLTVSTKEILVEEEVVPYEIEYVEDPNLYEGQEKVLIKGVNGSQKVLYSVIKENGEEVGRVAIDTHVLSAASPAKVLKGTKEKPSCTPTGDLDWPCSGQMTSGFGGRWGRLHGGIDIVNSTGTPILAADGGTVIYSGYNSNGYGYLVKIDHGNGIQTFYAHNSALLVKVGDKVFKGQQIAEMGNTGRSTGTHCHFEVHLNGKKVNPMNYL